MTGDRIEYPPRNAYSSRPRLRQHRPRLPQGDYHRPPDQRRARSHVRHGLRRVKKGHAPR